MRHMIAWSIPVANFAAAVERFATKNPQPPPGVALLGRWHEMGTGDGRRLVDMDAMITCDGTASQPDILSMTAVAVKL